MIFKTYKNNFDDILHKIGIGKRSFAEFGEQVKTSYQQGTTRAQRFGNAAQAVFSTVNKATSEQFTRNRSGKIVTSRNIDSYLRIPNESKAAATLKELQELQRTIAANPQASNWDDQFRKWKNNGKKEWQIDFVKNNDLQKASTEDVTKAIEKEREKVLANNSALKAQTLSAKASSMALKALSMAGNMLVMWGVSAAISLVSKGINESRQRIQKNKEAVDSLSSSYKEGQKTLKSNRDTAESLKDKYAELAKGVDKTGSNLSLTTDEFKEYQNISNQLADMFPSLVSGWDAQGNAILKCKDNVDALGQAYKDAELKKASDFINDDTYGKILDNYQDQIAKKQYTAKLNILTKVQNSKDAYIEEFKRLSNEAKNGDEKSQELYSYMTTLGDIGEIFDDKGETIPEAVAKIDWNSIRHNISTQMSLMQTEINDGLQSVKQAGMAQLTTAMYGETISEENADLAARIINSIDSSLADGMGTDEDIIKNWAVKIVDILKDESSNSGIKEAFSEIFAFDSSNMTPEEMKSEIDKYVDTVKPFFKEVFNTEDDHQIKLSFGLGDIDALADDYQNAIKAAKKKFNNETEDFNWDEWFKENSINTTEEISRLNDIVEACNTADEARKRYLMEANSGYKASDIFGLGNSEGTQTALGKLSSQLNEVKSAYSTLNSAINEYNQNGSLSIDTMQSVISLGDNWLDYINTENGAFTLDREALEQLTDARIEEMKQQALSSLISNVENISNEEDALKFLTSTNYETANSYKELAEAKLEDAKASLSQKLADGSISSDSYDKVIEKLENDAAKISNIFDSTSLNTGIGENISVTLADLESHADLLKTVRDEYEQTGRISGSTLKSISDSFSAISPEIKELQSQYESGKITYSEYFAGLEDCYNKYKYRYVSDSLYTAVLEAEGSRVKELGEAYSADFKNWKTVEDAKKRSELLLIKELSGYWADYYKITFDENGRASLEETPSQNYDDEQTAAYAEDKRLKILEKVNSYNEFKDELEKQTQNVMESVTDLSWQNRAKNSSSDSTDPLKEEFSKKLALLDHYHQMGYIKDEQYYRQLNDLNEEYFAGQEKYLDDYRSYSEKIYSGLKQAYKDMLDGQLGYMDQTVNAVTAFLDDGIEALNSQKEAVENEYETRISALENEQKALEEQQKSLEKQKEGIHEQIDAIQKANEARQKSIDLQKKQYELDRAMNQNTKQVYVNGQMVWQTDDEAVRNAGNELNNALSDAETDKLQARIDALDESSKAIDSQKDTIQEQIDSLNEELDKVTEGIDRQIEALQKYRDRWSEIPSNFEETQNSLAAVMMLGQDWQAGVLSMDEAMLANFGPVYTGIQGQIQAVTDASAMQIAQMAGLTCTSMGIMSAYTDEQLGIMSESISDSSIIGSDALAGLALSGSASLSGLADNVGTSSQLTADALGNIITAANDAREALEKLSSLQESAGLDGIPGLHGFMTASDASAVDSQNGAVPVDITLMKRGGIAGAGQSTASRTSHGVRVPAAGLAKELGEDCLVAVKEGEGFIPPEQVDSIRNFVDSLDEQSSKPDAMPQEDYWPAVPPVDIRDFMEKHPFNMYAALSPRFAAAFNPKTYQLPRLGPGVNNDIFNTSTVVNIQSGAITLNEMRDVSALGEAIVRELPNIVTRKLNPSTTGN